MEKRDRVEDLLIATVVVLTLAQIGITVWGWFH